MKGDNQMETVTINSEKIKQAIDNYMQDYILEIFEFFIGEPLYNFKNVKEAKK